jgi:hypothetical protein
MQTASPQTRFWRWFRSNGNRLYAAMYGPDEDARQEAANELREAVEAVEPGLVLEVASAEEGEPRTLIVSADGKPDKVDAVKDFAASAPALPGWTVVAFRQRLDVAESLEIVLEGERIGPQDIWFAVGETDDGLDLTLHVRGLTRANERLRGLGASLLAEHAVGEQDALTLIGALRVRPLPKAPAAAGLRPFKDLVEVFDAAKEEKYPPPGSLAIDPESDWQNMRGTIGGSPASVLLHAGLRRVAGHPAYDQRLTVSVPFHEVREDGMPATEEEYLAVTDLGDRLTEALREGQESLLALSIMTDGRRDLIFYTSDAEAALGRIEEIRAETESHVIEVGVERDTIWGTYRSFQSAAEGVDEEE